MANFSSDDSEKYEVEKIIDVRKRGNTTQYLVQWRGYESEEDTWESEKNLKGSIDAIDEFKRKQGSVVKTPYNRKTTKQVEQSMTKQGAKASKSVTHTTTVTKVTRTMSGTKSESSSPESSPLMGRRTLQTHVVTQSSTTRSGSSLPQKKACTWSLCPATLTKYCCNFCKMDCPTMIFLMCFLFIILTFVVQLPK